MNLVEQLKQTPKWKLFEDWYKKSIYAYGDIPFENWYCGGKPKSGFVDLSFDLQKGVFEKFIESCGQDYWQGLTGTHYLTYPKVACEEFNSFEKLLIWYFNN